MRRYVIPTGLLLLYAFTRLHHLESLPVFLDEAVHIRWAKLVWAGQWLTAAQDGRLLNIWWIALFWPFTGALWLARAVTVLWGALGLAAIMASGRLLKSPRVGWLAALLYILLPMAFFHDRMALTDPLQVTLEALLVLAAVRLMGRNHRHNRWVAIAAGGLMLALLTTKLLGLFWIGAPLLALLLVPAREWRNHVAYIAAAYATFGIGLAGFMALMRWRGSDFGLALAFSNLGGAPSLSGVWQRLGAHIQNYIVHLPAYLPGVLWVVIALGIGLALWRYFALARTLLALAAVPLLGLAVALAPFEIRYLTPALPALTLLVALGWDTLLARRSGLQQAALVAVLAAAILVGGPGRFMWQGWYAPAELALAPRDREQYINNWSSGSGIPEVVAFVQAAAAAAPTDLVVIDIGLIVRLSTYLGPEPNLYTLHDYDEPYLRIKVLYEGLDHPYASLADPQRQAFLLVRAPDENHRLTTLAVAAELVATFPKPDGELQYELYRLTPE